MVAVPATHPLARRASIRVQDLQDETVLLLEDGHCLRDQALEVCSQVGVQEKQDFRATSLETLRQMVATGAGVTLLPELATWARIAKPAALRAALYAARTGAPHRRGMAQKQRAPCRNRGGVQHDRRTHSLKANRGGRAGMAHVLLSRARDARARSPRARSSAGNLQRASRSPSNQPA